MVRLVTNFIAVRRAGFVRVRQPIESEECEVGLAGNNDTIGAGAMGATGSPLTAVTNTNTGGNTGRVI